MADQTSLFGGDDVIDIGFGAAPLASAYLTDVDALRRIADETDLIFCGVHADSLVIRSAADELQRLRTDLGTSEKARRTLARRIRALRLALGGGEAMDLSTEESDAP